MRTTTTATTMEGIWTREAVRAAALALNASDAAHVRAVLVATVTGGDTRALLSTLHLLDQAMKLSPVLIPVIRSVLVGTALPEACQPLLAHWAALRLVPATAPPQHGYFYWKKAMAAGAAAAATAAEGHTAATDTRQSTGQPTGQRAIVIPLAPSSHRAACAHCHDPFNVQFSDAQNAWVLADAVVSADGDTLLHADCPLPAR
jgi:hypothetical protein